MLPNIDDPVTLPATTSCIFIKIYYFQFVYSYVCVLYPMVLPRNGMKQVLEMAMLSMAHLEVRFSEVVQYCIVYPSA